MIIYIFIVIQICLISCFFLNIVSAAPPSFFGGYHIQSRKLGNFRCPNNCSGHGNCNNDYHCKCWAGWGYTGPDCSKSKIFCQLFLFIVSYYNLFHYVDTFLYVYHFNKLIEVKNNIIL